VQATILISQLNKNKFIYFFLLALLLCDRLLLLFNFNFEWVGSDDLVFWQAANDYAKGIFHEPYYYGQNYNFMLEALFAVPLIKLEVPFQIAFPLVTSFMAIFPYIFISRYLFKKNLFLEAICFLAIPICLPIEFGILTSITRGFISGLFFAGFLFIPLMEPTKRSSWIISAFSVSLGYIFNPNSFVFTLPVLLYLFLNNLKQIQFYFIHICIALPFLLLEHLAKGFYKDHLDHVVHFMAPIIFSADYFIQSVQILDSYFNYTSPGLWIAGWMIIPLFIFFGIRLWKHDRTKAIALIFAGTFLIASLFISKVNDQLDTIFFSSARMFLGIPLLCGLSFYFFNSIKKFNEKKTLITFLSMSLIFFSIKAFTYSSKIKWYTNKTDQGAVAIKRYVDLKRECEELNTLTKQHNIDLIIFFPNWAYNTPHCEFFNYCLPLITNCKARTIMTVFERRTWVFHETAGIIGKNVLVYNYQGDEASIKKFDNMSMIVDKRVMLLFKDNKLRTDSLLKAIKVPYIRQPYGEEFYEYQ
jgi:hypothetical protein